MIGADLKPCIVCKIPKPATTEFYTVDRSRPGGLAIRCRICNAAKSRDYYARNKEKEIARIEENKRLHGWGIGPGKGLRAPIPELPPDPGAKDPESTYQLVRLRELEWRACAELAMQMGLRSAESLIRHAVVTYLVAAGMLE